jgi:hypothetical protein
MELKDTITLLITGTVAFFTIISVLKGLVEYKKQGITKRTELFIQMRSRLREDRTFARICELLEEDDELLRDIPLIEKDRFLGFFEELALMKNSGLINDRVALYMFGYYAIRCFESKNFWYNLNREEPLWSLFIDFAEQMKIAEHRFQYKREEFHL